MFSYNILLKRHLNEDYLIGLRSSIFLASSSILFLGFVYLCHLDCYAIQLGIPALGILWSGLAIISNRQTTLALRLWKQKERQIEEQGRVFDYMRTNQMLPSHLVNLAKQHRFVRPRNRIIFTYILPLLFIILWISSLVWVIIR